MNTCAIIVSLALTVLYPTGVDATNVGATELIEIGEWHIPNRAHAFAYAPSPIADDGAMGEIPHVVLSVVERVSRHASAEPFHVRLFGPRDVILLDNTSLLNLSERARTWLAIVDLREHNSVLWLTIRPDYDGVAVRCGIFREQPTSRFGQIRSYISQVLPAWWQPRDVQLMHEIRANLDTMQEITTANNYRTKY